MLSAIFKVCGITIGTVILAAGVVLLTRVNAFRQVSQVPPHPWFERPTWVIAAPAIDAWCRAPRAPAEGEILMLPVRKTPERWEVSCPTGLALADALTRSNIDDVLFDVEAGVAEDLDKFVDIVRHAGLKRVGVHAASQRAARHLRKAQPGWVFAADDASLVRLHLFSNLFLEPAMDFWSDFVVTDGSDQRAVGPREVAELHRRRKRVIWADRTREPSVEVDGRVRF